MELSEFKSFLEKFSFFEAGEIVLSDDKLSFNYLNRSLQKGFVYIWVEKFESTYSIVYIGKAGKTLHARFSQHKGGFNGGSVTGRKNGVLIKNGISLGKRYLIYARKSPLIEVFGEQVPSESIEEIALIKKMNYGIVHSIQGKYTLIVLDVYFVM
ncbi:MAG: hypothetical protein JJ971_05180 [Balneolaceae bacterium]|nr:hypothetical protein [Balneolaceae bacterium]MBO6545770.1 hypothetical protein [Balneolaceae bacterium]MBO6647166.1 hypothetical protein [Balneolaceae bacterium]